MPVLLEICVDSIASAQAAKDGGADRLEVCSALALGGLTPSFGFTEQCVADLEMPVMMMIRPHDGGFVYSDDDFDTMLTDIEVAKSIGVQGVVFGTLTEQRSINIEQGRKLIDAAEGLETTFHRAFDIVSDPLSAFDELQQLGVTRLLTSGQARSAIQGAQLIRELVAQAEKTIVLAGAGVTAENVRQILDTTGVQEVHASASRPVDDRNSDDLVGFGASRRLTDEQAVREIRSALSAK